MATDSGATCSSWLELNSHSKIFFGPSFSHIFKNSVEHSVSTTLFFTPIFLLIPQAQAFADQVRFLKIKGERAALNGVAGLPSTMECAVILNQDNVYPGIFLSTDCGRMVRPVRFLATGETEVRVRCQGNHSFHNYSEYVLCLQEKMRRSLS